MKRTKTLVGNFQTKSENGPALASLLSAFGRLEDGPRAEGALLLSVGFALRF